MLILIVHGALVILLWLVLFATGRHKSPPKNATTIRGKIHWAIWWGMFFGSYFALAIVLGFFVESIAGSYCGHVTTGTGFLFALYRAKEFQNK